MESISRAAKESTTKPEFFRAVLKVLAEHFGASFATFRLDLGGGTTEQEYTPPGMNVREEWRGQADGLLLHVRYHRLAVARPVTSDGDVERTFLVAPVLDPRLGTIGAAAFLVDHLSEEVAAARVSEFQALWRYAGQAGAEVGSRTAASESSPGFTVGATLAKAALYENLEAFVFAMANGLKTRFGLDQVAVGVVRGRSVRVTCLSGFDDPYPRSPGTKVIQQAMEECLDAGEMIHVVTKKMDLSAAKPHAIHRLHEAWHQQAGGSAVASIPLRLENGSCVAVVSLRQSPAKPLTPKKLEHAKSLLEPMAAAVQVLRRADRGLTRHAWESLRSGTRRLNPMGRGRVVLLALALLAGAWFLFGQLTYRITVPCEVVPRAMREIAAPFAGSIQAVHVEAGDLVEQGQVLLEMDVAELLLQQEQAETERRLADLEATRALELGDIASAAMAEARADQARAELDSLAHQLRHAQVRAPITGHVLSGDLRQRVGEVVPLGEALLQLAPEKELSVELRIPEYAADEIAVAMPGWVATQARPGERHGFEISEIWPSSEVLEGENVFLAKGPMEGAAEWLRPGMRGIAKVEAGQRAPWWIAIHRVVDYVRLQLWKL